MTTTKEVVKVVDMSTGTKTKGGSEVVGAAGAHHARSSRHDVSTLQSVGTPFLIG
jgi:hypothetical protein